MSQKNWLVLAVMVAVVGCGDSDKVDPKNNDDNVRPGNNGGLADMGTAADSGGTEDDMSVTDPDVGPQPDMSSANNGNNVTNFTGCGDALVADTTIEIDAAGRGGQLYARVAWDGVGAWVVYNRPESMGSGVPEEVFAVRVGCDGTIEHGPIRLSEGSGSRNYMPVVASSGGLTHVVWVEQPDGGNPENIRLQILGSDGAPQLAQPTLVTPIGPEGPLSGLVWEPDVAVWPDGTGVVAVSAGGFGEFQVALQRYDAAGAPVGVAMIPYTEKGVDQKRPSLAGGEDGTIYVSWTRYKPEDMVAGTPEEPERAVLTSIPAGANMAFPAAPIPAKPLTDPNPIARYAKEPGPDGAHFLAFQVTSASRQDILVRDGADFETASTGTFGSAGWANFRPSIAGGETGGVLAWYRYNQTPLKNGVMIHPFAFDGTVTPGAEVEIPTDAPGIPPYGPGIAWSGGGDYFITWAEGDTAPQAKVKGRWIRL